MPAFRPDSATETAGDQATPSREDSLSPGPFCPPDLAAAGGQVQAANNRRTRNPKPETRNPTGRRRGEGGGGPEARHPCLYITAPLTDLAQ